MSDNKTYRILHVEDDKLFQTMVRLMLNDKMFIIDTAENGSIAVDKAFKNIYDIILMDVFMPIMDGRVAAQTIKNMSPDIPIIALSACEISDLINLVAIISEKFLKYNKFTRKVAIIVPNQYGLSLTS